MLSFVIFGLAARLRGCVRRNCGDDSAGGSAYTYACNAGRVAGVIIGWDLTLEYVMAQGVIAGWSNHFIELRIFFTSRAPWLA
jgi:hypothetical protein